MITTPFWYTDISILYEKDSIIVVYENIHDTKKLSSPTVDPKLELDRFRSRMGEIEKNLKKLNIEPNSNDFGLYGAGGGASLFLANFPWMKKSLSKVFDRDERKHNRFIPGTELVILPPNKIESSGIKKLLFLSTAIYKNVASISNIPDLHRGIKCNVKYNILGKLSI